MRELPGGIKKVKNIEKNIDGCLKDGVPIIRVALWGVGSFGKEAFEYLKTCSSYEIRYICDSARNKIGDRFGRYEVLDIKDIIIDGQYDIHWLEEFIQNRKA